MKSMETRILHGEYRQRSSATFLGAAAPEAYQHHVGDPATDLSKYPNSPGYRLILNNVLFPAAKKTVVPTVVINNIANKDDNTTGAGNVAPVNNALRSVQPTK